MKKFGSLSLVLLSGVASAFALSVGCSSDGGGGTRDTGSAGSGAVAGSGTGGTAGAGTGGATGGTAGAGTGGSTGGTTGGTAGGGTGGTSLADCTILPANTALITDFTPPAGEGGAGGGTGEGGAGPGLEGISFGYDANPPTVASGYSFRYPETLASDISTGAWHVSGTVDDWSGLVINFVCAANASTFTGISFKISGNVGTSGAVQFVVGTASNSWRDPALAEPSASSCVSASQYDGTCTESFVSVPVTEAEQTVTLTWADLAGGKPDVSPDPSEIMALRWIPAWSDGATPYEIDLTIDDLTFTQ